MEGWILAGVDDLNALANHYLAGEYFMGPGPDAYDSAASAMRNMVYIPSPLDPLADGPFLPTPILFYFIGLAGLIDGLAATPSDDDTTRVHKGYFFLAYDRFLNQSAGMSTTRTVPKDMNDLEAGAFFYRIP